MPPANDPIDDARGHLMEEAVELARRAGQLTLRHFRSEALGVEQKDDGTPVTVADREAERFLRSELDRRYPNDGVFGEEEDEVLGSSGRRWIIDPIDGTKAFTRGVGLYSNLLAVEDDGEIVVGVINLPALGETVYAAQGQGCWCDGQPARVSEHADLAGAYLCASSLRDWSDDAFATTRAVEVNVRTWGDGYGYALVATGRVDAMIDCVAALYDLAPMPVIMAEAGGRFSALDGDPHPGRGSGLATNGRIHDDLLEIFADHG